MGVMDSRSALRRPIFSITLYHILDGYSWSLDDYGCPTYSNDNDWLCDLCVVEGLDERTKKRRLVLELHCSTQETLYNYEKLLIGFKLTPNPNHLFYTLL